MMSMYLDVCAACASIYVYVLYLHATMRATQSNCMHIACTCACMHVDIHVCMLVTSGVIFYGTILHRKLLHNLLIKFEDKVSSSLNVENKN